MAYRTGLNAGGSVEKMPDLYFDGEELLRGGFNCDTCGGHTLVEKLNYALYGRELHKKDFPQWGLLFPCLGAGCGELYAVSVGENDKIDIELFEYASPPKIFEV